MRALADFHHSSLLRSLVLLFEGHLEIDLYRPIGMEWYDEGFWAVFDHPDTAQQFLSLNQAFRPPDGSPQLNKSLSETDGVHYVEDPGGDSVHRACTLQYFKDHDFDYVIASIPQHIEPFKRLIKLYNPKAKLIIQLGNNWPIGIIAGHNVLASVSGPLHPDANVFFYHQEFDTRIFRPTPCLPTKKIYSFVNVLKKQRSAWGDYCELQALMEPAGFELRAYGGQCPDGAMTGPVALADKMREAELIFNVKPQGDGYGHVIHNAYAVGRPIITRPSHYKGQLAAHLLAPGTFIDLDRYGPGEIQNIIKRLTLDPDGLATMGRRAAERFREVVDFDHEASGIAQWLAAIR